MQKPTIGTYLEMKHATPSRLKKIVLPVALALAVFVLLRVLVIDLILVQGRSMAPMIDSGQMVLVNRLAYGLRLPGLSYLVRWSSPRQGDILVFEPPAGPRRSIKLCIAGPGDPIPPGIASRAAVVGNDQAVVLGINTRESIDSRHFGPVEIRDVIGKAVVVPRGDS